MRGSAAGLPAVGEPVTPPGEICIDGVGGNCLAHAGERLLAATWEPESFTGIKSSRISGLFSYTETCSATKVCFYFNTTSVKTLLNLIFFCYIFGEEEDILAHSGSPWRCHLPGWMLCSCTCEGVVVVLHVTLLVSDL